MLRDENPSNCQQKVTTTCNLQLTGHAGVPQDLIEHHRRAAGTTHL